MTCSYDGQAAVAVCRKCGAAVCESCKRVFYDQFLCKYCTVKLYSRGCSLVKYDVETRDDENG
jgi:hypothetical protein